MKYVTLSSMIYFLLLLAPGNCLTFRRAYKDMRFDVSTSVIFSVLSRNV